MVQLLRAVEYLHSHWIIHRDLKMSNLLYNSQGQLKLADFGLARLFGSPSPLLTPKVVTLWYRAPELLLGAETYGPEIDVWAAGCIYGELIERRPLLPGSKESEQLEHVFQLLGTPDDTVWPGVELLPAVARGQVSLHRNCHPPGELRRRFEGWSRAGVDFLRDLLTYDPRQRPTAEDALAHLYFRMRPYPQKAEFMPTFPTRHDHDGDGEGPCHATTAPASVSSARTSSSNKNNNSSSSSKVDRRLAADGVRASGGTRSSLRAAEGGTAAATAYSRGTKRSRGDP